MKHAITDGVSVSDGFLDSDVSVPGQLSLKDEVFSQNLDTHVISALNPSHRYRKYFLQAFEIQYGTLHVLLFCLHDALMVLMGLI